GPDARPGQQSCGKRSSCSHSSHGTPPVLGVRPLRNARRVPRTPHAGAILAKTLGKRSTEMHTVFDSSPIRPGDSPKPRPWRNDGDYRVKLYKAASRAGHEDVERAVAALAEGWGA